MAIHCDDDYVGVLACRVAQHLGLVVPDDVAVLGFYDMVVARFSTPTLSSIPAPGQFVGAAGIQLLSDLLNGKRLPERQVLITPPPVAARESTNGSVHRGDDIRRAHQLIDQFACRGLRVLDLLEQLMISQKTLNKRFEAVYGEKPGAAIRRIRLERAQQWLATTELSIGRIAEMCGFSEPSNFNLFFRREAGCTPSAYRKQARS